MFYSKSTGGFYSPEIHGESMPGDVVEISEEFHSALLTGQAAGQVITADAQGAPRLVAPAPLSVAERVALLLRAVDARLDAGAATRRYDNIRSAALRAGYPGPFHAEGVIFATWMDATYAKCYEILAQWEAGAIPEPSADELLAMLPSLELP